MGDKEGEKEIEKNNDRSNIVATPKSPILGPVTVKPSNILHRFITQQYPIKNTGGAHVD